MKTIHLFGLALAGLFAMGANAGEVPVNMGAAKTFAVLGGSTVSNFVSQGTQITGDIGLSPGNLDGITGFPPGTVNGTMYADDNGTSASMAQASLSTAYDDAAARALAATTLSGDIGGLTLPPGVYFSTSSLAILAGNLTLDGQGDPHAVWIFQAASTLTTTSGVGGNVVLTNGAQARNVFWQIGSSATLGLGTSFSGTLMVFQSITLGNGASVEGRVLARHGAVTMASNIITAPVPGRSVGDFDESGCTDLGDFLFMLDNWNMEVDGKLVSIDDFLSLLDNWLLGPTCP